MTMKEFSEIKPAKIDDNFIRLIGSDWMLVTAGDARRFNTMTASWGGVGYLWNKPVVFVFIRPQRYTFGFMEEKDVFTLSFFEEKYRSALQLCGSVSGKEVDKVEKTGLTPCESGQGAVAFREARLVLECRKLYTDFVNAAAFTDQTLIAKNYPDGDFHKLYVAEIVGAWRRD